MQPRAPASPARRRTAPAAVVLSLLAACSTPPGVIDTQRDGPPSQPPPDLMSRPEPEPRVEPIRSGGPNKPYQVLGRSYTPVAADLPMTERGLASWYGRKFHGRPTASGEPYDMYAFSAAHRTMPLPSWALVRNPANGRELVVRVNDRGPFHEDRVIDLSYAAALKLDLLRGVAPVEVRRLTHEDIRSGRWREASVVTVAARLPAEAVADAADDPAPPEAAAAGYWLQLGAFRQRQGAHALREQMARELAWLEPWLTIVDERALYRLQAGPFGTRGEAQSAAERIRGATAMQPVVLQRR